MSTVLAWERLYDGVVASFATDGIRCENVFGWRGVRQHAQERARIAWVPGDPGNAVGTVSGARNPGGIPRSLATLGELFTVYISNQDPSAPENERKQYHLTRLLRDAWHRAVYRLAHGTLKVVAESWIGEPHLERRYGATIRLVCEVQAPVWDMLPSELLEQPSTSGTVDAVAEAMHQGTTLGAAIDVVMADALDGVTIPPGGAPPVSGSDGEAPSTSYGAGVQSSSNKAMAALATHHDGDLATPVPVLHEPAPGAFVCASVNGLQVTRIGNGTKIGAEAYFSNDFGSTARAWSEIRIGDTLHWQGSVAGYELEVGDLVDVWYEQQ